MCAARKLAAVWSMVTLVGASSAAFASDGIWKTEFWGERKCNSGGRLIDEDQYIAFGFSWNSAKSAVDLMVVDMKKEGDPPTRLALQSPSLAQPLIVEDDLTGSLTGPQVDAFRRDVGEGAAWRVVATAIPGLPRRPVFQSLCAR